MQKEKTFDIMLINDKIPITQKTASILLEAIFLFSCYRASASPDVPYPEDSLRIQSSQFFR